MNIFVDKSHRIEFMCEYMDFNSVAYQDINLNKGASPNLPDEHMDCSNELLITSSGCFVQMTNWDVSRDRLVQWLQNGNRLIITRDGDSFVDIGQLNQEYVYSVDRLVPKNSIIIVSDFKMSDTYWPTKLQNFHIVHFPNLTSFMGHKFGMPRIMGTSITKSPNSKDFLLTMIKRSDRPHRDVLWRDFQSRQSLKDRGHVMYHRLNEGWLGYFAGDDSWPDGVPSMDLYNNAWVELVPECFYKNGYYITEKTIKPMATFTPFLIVGTAKYLEYLRQLGFKTFDGLIDENYDNMYHIQDRVKLVLDQLEDISRNGAEDFYNSCQPIMQHNFQNLSEIFGSWRWKMDQFLKEVLDFAVDR